jgi:hypothetical protein
MHQFYGHGDVIITEGIMSNNAYSVLKGSVKISNQIDKKIVSLEILKREFV